VTALTRKFVKSWERPRKESTYSRFKRFLIPPEPLKQRLYKAIRCLRAQMERLGQIEKQFARRDKELFAAATQAYANHDLARATMYANELLEIRKLARITVQSQLALEQIVLRLETVELIGDMAVTLAPATTVLKSVSDDVGWVVPEAEKEFESVGEVLDGLLVESWSRKEEFFDARAASENARKILESASEVAEEMIKERLPALPPALLAAREKITA